MDRRTNKLVHESYGWSLLRFVICSWVFVGSTRADESPFEIEGVKVGCACDKNKGWEIEHIDKDWIKKSGTPPPPSTDGAPGETRTPTS
ncbi:MAG: hypothetical protein LBF65_00320 [Holosporales bacterium]|nr:hypothetical protein [Holosporales bacterium]